MKVSDQVSSIFKAPEDILRSKTGPFESKSKGIVYKFERKPWFFGTSNLRGTIPSTPMSAEGVKAAPKYKNDPAENPEYVTAKPYPVLPCQPRE